MSSVEKAIEGKKTELPSDRLVGLAILKGADTGRAFVLSKKSRVTFGREEADVDLQDPGVSKEHCAIEIYKDIIVLRDLGSASGTFLNEFQITLEFLKSGDKFRVGDSELQVLVKMKK